MSTSILSAADTRAEPHEHDLGPMTRWLYGTLKVLLALAFVAELVVLLMSLVARNLLGFSILWSDEVASLALAVMTFIGGALAYPLGHHLATDVVQSRVSTRALPVLKAAVDWVVLGVAVGGVDLGVQGWHALWVAKSPILGLSQLWFALPFPIGMALLALFAAGNLVRSKARDALWGGLGVATAAIAIIAVREVHGPLPVTLTLIVSVAVLLTTLLLGVPIAFDLVGSSMLFLYFSDVLPPTALPTRIEGSASGFVLISIPFFIAVGYILTHGGLAEPLANALTSFVGHVRGGLLHVMILTMFIFSGISGSKIADMVGVGSALNRLIDERGYPREETTAVLATSTIMGETIPPSVVMIVLGSITTLSITELFIAGLLPAVLLGIVLALVAYRRSRHASVTERSPWRERTRLTAKAVPALAVPVLLVGGIVFGLATPTEMSSIVVLYGVLIALTVYRTVTAAGLINIVVTTSVMSGMLLFLTSSAAPFAFSLTLSGVPQGLTHLLAHTGGSKVLFLLASLVILIIVGQLLEGLPAVLIFGPLLLPLAALAHINEVHYAVFFLIALAIGMNLPPMGIGLYIAAGIGGVKPGRLFRAMVPYMLALVIGLLIIGFVPDITLALVHLLYNGDA